MSNLLCKRILLLPKEIQDLIYTFNAEHRDKMKKTFKNIHNIMYNCWICDIYIIEHIHRDCKLMRRKLVVCSKECENEAIEELIGVP